MTRLITAKAGPAWGRLSLEEQLRASLVVYEHRRWRETAHEDLAQLLGIERFTLTEKAYDVASDR